MKKTLTALTKDEVWFLVLQTILVLAAIYAAGDQVRENSVKQSFVTQGDLTVPRGERSMTWLYFVYSSMIVFVGLVLTEVEKIRGYKIFWALLDYVIITYLFLFSGWFRNIMFQLYQMASVN